MDGDQSSDANDSAPPPPGRVFIYSKGAPEEILKICDQIYIENSRLKQFDEKEQLKIIERVDKM